MPLKSATCGRELEAGLRRRPGSNNVTFDGKPLDGVFVMHSTVTPVRRQDDYGIDLYCTLSDRIARRAVVRDYFVVQVKSGTDPWIFEHEESVKWLVEYPNPLFLACVD